MSTFHETTTFDLFFFCLEKAQNDGKEQNTEERGKHFTTLCFYIGDFGYSSRPVLRKYDLCGGASFTKSS